MSLYLRFDAHWDAKVVIHVHIEVHYDIIKPKYFPPSLLGEKGRGNFFLTTNRGSQATSNGEENYNSQNVWGKKKKRKRKEIH